MDHNERRIVENFAHFGRRLKKEKFKILLEPEAT
jgi:hypothetical protein